MDEGLVYRTWGAPFIGIVMLLLDVIILFRLCAVQADLRCAFSWCPLGKARSYLIRVISTAGYTTSRSCLPSL
jgi:hypothetical protein